MVSSAPEIQWVALRNIDLLPQHRSDILQNKMRVFFCKFNDPPCAKVEKLDAGDCRFVIRYRGPCRPTTDIFASDDRPSCRSRRAARRDLDPRQCLPQACTRSSSSHLNLLTLIERGKLITVLSCVTRYSLDEAV
jgi:hypothetical protein